jgi:cytochrome c-type biogenesis protein CcmF
MIAEAGLAALWLATAFALLQLVLAGVGVAIAMRTEAVELANGVIHVSAREAASELMRAVRPVAVVQGVLVVVAFAALVAVFVSSDMSVLLVVDNSHSLKPLIYKIAGTWGNHEGSMLLWVMVLGLAGAFVALAERSLDAKTLTATLGAQALIALGFYAYLAFASNPFTRVNPAPPDGNGLNPLLQDPGLAFHPPTLYLGYVGLSVAFSFAVGALVTRDVGPRFARAMRPWALGAWILLTIGITAGSYWAYYELGWGGWWFWDPTENASLMPWLAATALLHSVTVLATRDGLRAWTIMLAVVAFSMSMVGTFLVRSGVLVSVHAFAVDPTRGSFLLALLALYIGGALVLFAARIATVTAGTTFELVSREAGLVLNNLLLSVVLGIVLIGTIYPVIAQSMGVQLSIGPPFFNKTAGPIALVLMVALAAGPLLRWRRDSAKTLGRRMLIPLAVSGVTLIVVLIAAPGIALMPLLGLVLAPGLAVGSVMPLAGRNLLRTPLYLWGMVIAHVGVAVAVAGMASDTAFTRERLVALHVGEATDVGPFQIRLKSIGPALGPNWSALEAELVVDEHGSSFTLRPQQRFFSAPPQVTNESAIKTLWNGQLYTVLGREDGGRWQLRLWWKPFVTLIWAGGFMIAIGGAVSLLGRLRRERRVAKRQAHAEMPA